MYSKSFVEGEGGVPINPSPLNILENSHLLNSQCKILKKGLGHPTPLANKIIAQTLLEKKISGSNYAVNYLSSCETKIKSNFIVLFGSQLRFQSILITVILFIVSSQNF